MTKDVFLIIKGVQRYPGEEPLETRIQVSGEYFLRGQSQYVMFEETQEGFTESVKSMLKLKNNCVELVKKGLIQSHMTFVPQALYVSEYKTPFGSMQMGVRTKELQILNTEELIQIYISYLLEVQEQMVADCSIQITIKER